MVDVFRRSFSFQNKNLNRSSKPHISHQTRSISLPGRSHPLISHLKNQIIELISLSTNPKSGTSAWLIDSLSRLKDVHDSLSSILQLPQTQESLRKSHSLCIENILEDLLRFVDVYGIFQTSLMAFKEEELAAQVALRKKDDVKIALYIKARKQIAREMIKLASTVRSIKQHYFNRQVDLTGEPIVVSIGNAELVEVIGDVMEVTSVVSAALFNGIYSAFSSRKSAWIRFGTRLKGTGKVDKSNGELIELMVDEDSLSDLREKKDDELNSVLKRMLELESCIGGIELGGERVFRSLINSRVSLLNTLTK